MHTPLLPHRAARPGTRRLLGAAAGLALLLGATEAQAQTVYGLGTLTANVGPFSLGQQGLVPIDPGTGAAPIINTPISGVTSGQTLVGIDYRPFTGQLYALGYNAATTSVQLYTLEPATSVATPVAAAFTLNLGSATDRIGFDFNPLVDRIRVVSTQVGSATADNNFRLSPITGGLMTVDGDLDYPATDVNGALTPGIGSVAYTNSNPLVSASTVLYAFDELNNGILAIQDPPNNGTLNTAATVTFNGFGVGIGSDLPRTLDLDIYYNPDVQQNQGFISEVTPGGSSNFYAVNLATGVATRRGNTVPSVTPFEIRDIAVAPAAPLTGQLAYGVTTAGILISFDTNNPTLLRSAAPVTNLAATQQLVGTDFRPNTGQLFGLGYNTAAAAGTPSANVYTIDLATGAATAVGSTIILDLGTDANSIGFDFNPTVDRIRVVSANNANYRLNPNNGAVAFTDGAIKYPVGTPNAGVDPNVGSAAYVNSFVGATTTFLYTIDHALGLINLQNPPNNGDQNPSRSLTGVNGAGVGGAINALNDFDAYYDATTATNIPYLTAIPSTGTTSRLYRLANFSTTATTDQAATDIGAIGRGLLVRDISLFIRPSATVAVAPGAVTGQLVYALAGGNLISFDSNAPGIIRSAVNFGVGIASPTQTVVGFDFRPANGQLYALGYDAALASPAPNAQLYTVNLTTGGLMAVGTAVRLDLGGLNAANAFAERVGFDFNPTVDRIRVVSTNGANYRLVPTTGAVASTDPNLNGATGPFSAAAYTNNQAVANTTQQFVFSSNTGAFNLVTNPNGGVVSPTGINVTGTSTTDGGDFDIFNTPGTSSNVGFIATAASTATTSDNLYVISDIGGANAVTNNGRIGISTNVSGLAAFISAGNLLTWNGSQSTDWATAANWTPNIVPTTAYDVLIPSGTPNQPTVSGAQSARLVTLSTGAVLTLATSGTLTTGGSFTNNGGSVAGTGTLVLGGTASVIGGTSATTFPNLTITNAATTAATVAVQRALTLNGTLTVSTTAGQTFTLLSNAAGSAYVVNNGAAVLAGTATVQRYITPTNGGAGYRHYSAPVSNSTVADLAAPGFAPVVNPGYNTNPTPGTTSPFPNVFGYNESQVSTSGSAGSIDFDKGFFSPNALGDALEVTRGYTVNLNANALVDFTGLLNNGTTALVAGSLTRGGQAESGYQLRGNPFPSPLDWDAMVANSRLSNVNNALYVFKSSGQYTGSYASYVNGVPANGGTNVLPVAQGFFVRTAAAGQTGSLAFTNQERLTTDPGTPFQRGNETRPLLALTLRSATAATQVATYFEQGATAAFDRAFDAAALPNANGLLLATEAGSELLAINGQPALTGADVLLPLRLSAATAGTYILAVDELINLPIGYHAYLRDALTGTYTDLATTPTIGMTLAANAPAGGHYALLFSTQVRVLANAPAALARLASVYPNPARGTATLLLPAALRANQPTLVTVVDNLGRTVLSRTLPAGAAETLDLPLATLAPGIYSVQARTNAGLVAKRLVVE